MSDVVKKLITDDLANLDAGKQKIVVHKDGPMLVIAGPGAGKTMAIVERVVYMVVVRDIKPENIMVATFTEKAAKELITRISNRLLQLDYKINLNDMYIGTLHSIFLRILEENRDFTNLHKNYKTLEQFDQKYLIYTNLKNFLSIEHIEEVVGNGQSRWYKAERLIKYLNKVSEEALDPNELASSDDKSVTALGKAYIVYQELLKNDNAIDFSSIQTETLHLLESSPEVLRNLQEQIQYMMIDEYQDTNTVQEYILLKIAGENANICVVGDEDQGLYRFRGASVRNILQFADNFPVGKCKTEILTINYRSHPDIINFYNKWMEEQEWEVNGKRFRYDKNIIPREGEFSDNPAVIKVTGDNEKEWIEECCDFLKAAKTTGVLKDYNQVAFLFRSVKGEDIVRLTKHLEKNDIDVFAPRMGLFFDREEIKLAIGALVFIFPKLTELHLKWNSSAEMEIWNYYNQCGNLFAKRIKEDLKKHKPLLDWALSKAKTHFPLTENTNYSFVSLFYQMLKYPLFAEFLDVDLNAGPTSLRPAYNIALFTQFLAKFEYLYNITVLTPGKITNTLRHLFNQFFNFLKKGGIEEYEDFDEYAPSGCVSVMTIHQSKGLEFPIVFAGSLNKSPRKQYSQLDEILEKEYFHRTPFEPLSEVKFYDFWRLYYTAFSRAQNLLVLTGLDQVPHGMGRQTNSVCEDIVNWKEPDFNMTKLELKDMKPVNLKNEYSFTSDILLYENCPRQYMFYNLLEFSPKRVAAPMFGSLVHQTIEDIHKAVLRNEETAINNEQIEDWFNENYNSITKSMRTYLDDIRKNDALDHVLRYFDKNKHEWHKIKEAEFDVSLVTDKYILRGVIDLLKGEEGTVEIVDFKSDDKININSPEDRDKLNRYRRQLEIYAHIVEEKTGQNVSKMHLYYTKEKAGSPFVSFNRAKANIEKTRKEFDGVVGAIEKNNFDISHVKMCKKLCDNCDMAYFCKYK